MNKQQLAYFALLGADMSNYRTYMQQCNDQPRAIKALIKYDNLPTEAIQWLTDEKILNLKPVLNTINLYGRESV